MVGLLNVPAGVSRVHASRRVFQHLADTESDLAIIHHASFPQAAEVRTMHDACCDVGPALCFVRNFETLRQRHNAGDQLVLIV